MANFVKPENALKRAEGEEKRRQRILEEETVGLFGFTEAERRRKDQTERKAKLDELAEKQRQRERELDEKERLWKESILRKPAEPLRPVEPPLSAEPVAVTAATAAPTSGKFVPRHKRVAMESATGTAPPQETDRWGARLTDDRPPLTGDSWRNNDCRPTSFSSGLRSWSSSRRV